MWGNLNINDFASFEPDTPSSNELLHFIFDTVSQLWPVLKDITDGQISNPVSDDRNSHVLKFLIGNSWSRLCEQILTKTFIASEWSIFFSVYTPDKNSWDFDTLHLCSNLLSFEIDFVNETRELHVLISRQDPSAETDASFDHFSISDYNKPFIRRGLNIKLFSPFEQIFTWEVH